jgi:hypothetical protein
MVSDALSNITTTYVLRREGGGGRRSGVQEGANEVNIINHASG